MTVTIDEVAIRETEVCAASTRRILRRALECLIGNGVIVPAETSPAYIVMDPPYQLPKP